ncbi:MAG TPA: YezD family protein [Actinomycetota bacterium]|nr:YezD family protein [Actinomycetota bacterium]
MSDDTTTGGSAATGVGATNDDAGTGDQQLAALDLSEEERLVLAKVAGIVRRINYGTVVLVIQDGKVVQIEMAEKFRLR